MCQVRTGAYMSLLAPGQTDDTACHPRKTTTYILHVVSIITHTHDRRKSRTFFGKKKQRTNKKRRERKEKRRKRELYQVRDVTGRTKRSRGYGHQNTCIHIIRAYTLRVAVRCSKLERSSSV